MSSILCKLSYSGKFIFVCSRQRMSPWDMTLLRKVTYSHNGDNLGLFFLHTIIRTYLHHSKESRKIKWITSDNTTIISTACRMKRRTWQEILLVLSARKEAPKTECGCSRKVWAQWRDMNRAMTSKTAWCKQEQGKQWRRGIRTGSANRARAHSDWGAWSTEAQRNKSIDDRTDRRRSHLIII